MERPKFVLGLRADAQQKDFGDDDSDGNFFSSDSGDEGNLLFAAPTIKPAARIPSMQIAAPKKKVTAFTDASTRITNIVLNLESYIIPKKEFQQVYLVPGNPATEALTVPINKFLEGETAEMEIDIEGFDDNILAQIDLIKYSKDKSIDVKKYESCKMDPRISALIFFILSETSDKGESCYYLLSSIEETLKIPSYAPVSILFKDFSIRDMLDSIAKILCNLFPKHPILESVIHSISHYVPTVVDYLQSAQNTVEDDDDDFSDSFFASLKVIADSRAKPTLQMTIDDTATNALASNTAAPKIEMITVKSPPNTATYNLPDGTDVLGPQPFADWIISMRTKARVTQKQPTTHRKDHTNQQSHSYQSEPVFAIGSSGDEKPPKEFNEAYLISLFDHFEDPPKLLNMLPPTPITSLFPLYYPTLEFINTTKVSAAVKRGCPYPALIQAEYVAHCALLTQDNNGALSAVNSLLGMVHIDGWFADALQPLKDKRSMPKEHIQSSDDVVSAMALADIEFILDGRSPLTCARIVSNFDADQFKHPAVDRLLRVNALYKLYTTHEFSPYIAFRVGFAVALAIADSQPDLACEIAFEAVYMLNHAYPQLSQAPVMRSASLFLAEMLEKTDRYYYAVMALDNFFRSDTKDCTQASAIAPIAQRNRDMVRAVFHYTESIKRLIADNKSDQALYMGKTIAGIYSDNGLNGLAISLLTFLLKRSYSVTTSRRVGLARSAEINATSGSLRSMRPAVQFVASPDFRPDPASVNTALVALYCAELMISAKLFTSAEELISGVEQANGGMYLGKMITFLKIKLLLKRNQFRDFIAAVPRIDINKINTNASRMSIDAGAAFDSSAAIIRLLAKSYLEHQMFEDSIFFAEVIIQASGRTSSRETGIGYLVRGSAFYEIFLRSHVLTDGVNLTRLLTPRNAELASYVRTDYKHSRQELVNEAASSLMLARTHFERVGSLKKSVEASLKYVDLLLRVFFDPLNPGQPNDVELVVGQPNFIIKAKVRSTLTNVDSGRAPITLKRDNVLDELGVITSFVEKNSARLMHPIYIIWSQLILARLNAMKGNEQLAQTYFDFAMTNITKHFASGPTFVPRRISVNNMRSICHILTGMCELLMFFSQDFINDRLVLFDILADASAVLHQRLCIVTPDAKGPLMPSVDMDIGILELTNPKLPDFVPLLREVGFLDREENDVLQKKRGFGAYIRHINANIRLFETQKLTEGELHTRNRQICFRMEQLAEANRLQKQSLNPVDTSFSVGVRHMPSLKGVVFIQKLFGRLIIYVPNEGKKNVIELTSSASKKFVIKTKGSDIDFQTNSGIFPVEFCEGMASYLFVDKKNHNLLNPRAHLPAVRAMRPVLFEGLLDLEIFKKAAPVVPDTRSLSGDSGFFMSNSKKGALSTLDVGTHSPLIFVVSRDLAGLPLEQMFQENFVLRAHSFTRLLLHKPPVTSFPHSFAFRWGQDIEPTQLLRSGVMRSSELVRESIAALGGCFPPLPRTEGTMRLMPLPFPLFSSNRKNEDYATKYEFCRFVPLKEGEPPAGLSSASLFLFTLADLAEMPEMVTHLIADYPFAFFMFIPAAAIRDAFKEMKLIFARQKQRLLWVMSNTDDDSINQDRRLCKDGVEFVGALQRTLMEKLKVPIVLFAPLGQ